MSRTCGRQLGVGESMYAKINAKGFELASSVIFMNSHTAVTKGTLRECMRWIMHRHPLLRMSIVEKGGMLYWAVSYSMLSNPTNNGD